MKFILVSFMICSSFAFAEGGEGITGPGDYYNPDVKCSIHSGVTLYLNLKPELRMTASYYDSRANRVKQEALPLSENMASGGQAELYQIESKFKNHGVSYLAIQGHDYTILNANGGLVATCVILPGANLDEPRFP